MTATINPFTQVYEALWQMAEANSQLMELVRPYNRIKYNEQPPKPAIADSDLPELQLLSHTLSSNIMNTSSTSMVTRVYSWLITTGEYDINRYYNLVAWELYRAMISWRTVLCSLEWPADSDWNYVVRTNVLEAEEGTTMWDENRNIAGWAGMWTIDVEMHFRTSDLLVS